MRDRLLAAAAICCLLATSANARSPKCTSICHLFDAYAIAKVCPNFKLNAQYTSTYRELFAHGRSAQIFKAGSLDGVFERISKAVNVCAPGCMKLEINEGTPCQYLTARPTIPDDD